MMEAVVFSFSKPVHGSTVASARIANYLARTIKARQLWGKDIAEAQADVLFLVNGAFAFCDCLPELAIAIRRFPRVIWVQNDYTIVPPSAESAAQSPFRKAFVERRAAQLPDLEYWTTIDENVRLTPGGEYINWNSLTFEPLPAIQAVQQWQLLYYGAFRDKRVRYFDRYFKAPTYPVCVSSTSKKFVERYSQGERITFETGISRECFYEFLGRSGFGLYLEDAPSHKKYMSPANRFYEMLSAHLPMLFQSESVAMMRKAGYDVQPYVLYSTDELHALQARRDEIAQEQFEQWGLIDHRALLTQAVQQAYARLEGR
jgi:hypothetical protein